MSILQQLYDSEINATISTFWNGGFTAKIGDEINGFKGEETFDSYALAECWLANQARLHFPNSKFASQNLASQ
jgi:hypothetical protein